MIYQPVMEQTLRRGVERYPEHVKIRFGQEARAIAQDADGVIVTTRDPETSALSTIRAKYLLACDGGSSSIRTFLNVGLVGTTLDTLWVVIDAKVKRWWPERHLLTFWADAKRPMVDIPLALGNHRWEFPLDPGELPLEVPASYRSGWSNNVVPANVARVYVGWRRICATARVRRRPFDDAVEIHRIIAALESAHASGRRVSPNV